MYKRDNQLFVFWPFLVRFRLNLGLNNLEFVNKSISAVNTLIVYLCSWSKNTLLHLIAGTYARAFDCRNVRSCIWLRERMLLCLIAGTYALAFDCGNVCSCVWLRERMLLCLIAGIFLSYWFIVIKFSRLRQPRKKFSLYEFLSRNYFWANTGESGIQWHKFFYLTLGNLNSRVHNKIPTCFDGKPKTWF